ncbi:MAG: type II secretion system protein [Candidatus Omnitrophica bacterium]|nr:type II secretion system protein [Candidatus Omnitrophota bacterium]
MWNYARNREPRPFSKGRGERGLTYLEVVTVVGIVALLATLALSQPRRGRITANEQAAIQTLRTVFSGLGWYQTINNSFPTNLSVLASATPPYVEPSLAAGGTRQGYLYAYQVGSPPQQFTMIATPQFPGVTGVNTFMMDESGTIDTQEVAAISAGRPPGGGVITTDGNRSPGGNDAGGGLSLPGGVIVSSTIGSPDN